MCIFELVSKPSETLCQVPGRLVEGGDVTCQVKHFGALVAAEQLSSVLADGTPILVRVVLRFCPCLRRRRSRWLRRLCFRRFRSQRRRQSLGRLPRFGLRPGAAVREAGANTGPHLSTTIAGTQCVRFKNNTKEVRIC